MNQEMYDLLNRVILVGSNKTTTKIGYVLDEVLAEIADNPIFDTMTISELADYVSNFCDEPWDSPQERE